MQQLQQAVPYRSDSAHGLGHALQVARLAFQLAEESGEEHAVCVAAYVGGYLHDCGRKSDRPGEPHGLCGATRAEQVMLQLVQAGHLNVALAEKIKYAILYHSAAITDGNGLVAAIWDADRLATHGSAAMPELLSSAAGKARVLCPE